MSTTTALLVFAIFYSKTNSQHLLRDPTRLGIKFRGAGAGTGGSVIFTSTNPKVTQTVSGAAVARELGVLTHQGFFNIDKAGTSSNWHRIAQIYIEICF